MNFNKHSNLEGAHAFLSASSHTWLNYTDSKLIDVFRNSIAAARGSELHAFAAKCIKLKQKLPRSSKTLNMYVNDSIGFRMTPEQVLYYSDNCFGTTDAISFRDDELRIHDYKSGVTPASMDQLYIYAALFCLEYKVDPRKIFIETRIYQCDDIMVSNPHYDIIEDVMQKIIHFDKIINDIKKEEY